MMCRNLGSQGSKLVLRVAYLLPENLMHYVGPAGVWADVNEILSQGLHKMKVPFRYAHNMQYLD